MESQASSKVLAEIVKISPSQPPERGRLPGGDGGAARRRRLPDLEEVRGDGPHGAGALRRPPRRRRPQRPAAPHRALHLRAGAAHAARHPQRGARPHRHAHQSP